MKILLKTFHLKLNDTLYHPGDTVEITKAKYEALAEDYAGAFSVVEEKAEAVEKPVKRKKAKA